MESKDKNVRLKEATRGDYELMLAWRSNPIVYQGFFKQTEPLKWEEHIEWLTTRDNDTKILIVEYEGRKVGVITLSQLDCEEPEIGYYIGETSLWGKGIGEKAVTAGIDYLRTCGKRFVIANIAEGNQRSLRLALSLGFEIKVTECDGYEKEDKNAGSNIGPTT